MRELYNIGRREGQGERSRWKVRTRSRKETKWHLSRFALKVCQTSARNILSNHSKDKICISARFRLYLNLLTVLKEYAIGISMDLKKAFDATNHSILLDKREFCGSGKTALNWLRAYLKQRCDQYIQIYYTTLRFRVQIWEGITLVRNRFHRFLSSECFAKHLYFLRTDWTTLLTLPHKNDE